MFRLLNLPLEILNSILCHLDLFDLISVSKANKFLSEYVRTDQVLRYHVGTKVAMVETNPHVNQPTSERLAILNNREAGWSELKFDFRTRIPVKHSPSGIYDMTGGVYLLGDQSKKTLHYCPLPSNRTDPVEWKKITIDKTLVDMGLAIYEHDLVAIVTTTPHHSNIGSYVIEVMLLQFSTGKPHPLARNPTLFVTEARWPRPAIGIEIVGDHLALVLNHFLNPFQPRDRFYVFDWKTGNTKMEVLAAHHTYSGIVFLSPTLLLLPNTRSTTLDIWEIPSQTESTSSPSTSSSSSSSSSSTPSTSASTPPSSSTSNSSSSTSGPNTHYPILCLELPVPAPGQAIITFSCRGEPNPTLNGLPHSSQPFHSSSADAIVIFNIRIQHLGLGRSSTFSMFSHRSSLLSLCQTNSVRNPTPQDIAMAKSRSGPANPTSFAWQNWLNGEPADEGEPADLAPVRLLWESWGPPITRWFDAADMPTRWITTSAGQRCVLSGEPGRRVGGGGGGGGNGNGVNNNNNVNGNDNGNGDDDDDDDDGGGDENDEDDEEIDEVIEVPLKVLDFNPLTVKRVLSERRRNLEANKTDKDERLTVVTTPSTIQGAAFTEPIESSLPYISFSCSGNGTRYEFEGILMDEERLLGLRTNTEDSIVEIDVMHVGIGTGDYV